MQEVLERPSYAEAARRVAASFARYGNGAVAVELLGELAARGRISAARHEVPA
jgi:hypothetical protein